LEFLPTWIIEGTAEYTETLPYRAGIFRADAHKNAMKERVDGWRENQGFHAEILDLDGFMRQTNNEWKAECSTPQKMNNMYHRAQLLVYYFSHLDGDKKGTRFIRYMEAVRGEVEALRQFFRSRDVKRLSGGRFQYDSKKIRPPDRNDKTAPFKHLPILLDGRNPEQLAQEISAGYRSIGIKTHIQALSAQ
jgi:hypothetical protein